jgi:hypothetical protein
MKLTEAQRAKRNLRPHAEARLAMCLWSDEYAFKQRGGSMDFWDTRTPRQQRLCRDIVDEILKAEKEDGRSALQREGE